MGQNRIKYEVKARSSLMILQQNSTLLTNVPDHRGNMRALTVPNLRTQKSICQEMGQSRYSWGKYEARLAKWYVSLFIHDWKAGMSCFGSKKQQEWEERLHLSGSSHQIPGVIKGKGSKTITLFDIPILLADSQPSPIPYEMTRFIRKGRKKREYIIYININLAFNKLIPGQVAYFAHQRSQCPHDWWT